MIDRPSPNFGVRPAGGAVDLLILHYTGMATAADALARLCDPESGVSAHYMIDEDGAVTRLVADDMRAWHAGVSSWAGASDINDRSIGIELVNPGHEFGYRPFPEAQMAALEALAIDVVQRHSIPARRVLGHSDVAPDRKTDPGEFFDWQRLAAAGIGLWPSAQPDELIAPAAAPGGEEAARLLAEFGYLVAGPEDAYRHAVTAFQRHFRPSVVDGEIDTETFARLTDLCDLCAQCA